jgi:hypothetical protein
MRCTPLGMERKVTHNGSRRESTPDERTGTTGSKLAGATAASVVVALLAQGWSLEECLSLVELFVLLWGLARD